MAENASGCLLHGTHKQMLARDRGIITEMGKSLQELDSDNIKELSKITSLSTYKVRKYLKFQDFFP